MQIWRIDATFVDDDGDEVGAMTTFVIGPSAENELTWFRDSGWYADAYEVEEELVPHDRDLLLGHYWPVLKTERLLELARSPKTDARRQLERIVANRKVAVA
jgi:hypothetical protein